MRGKGKAYRRFYLIIMLFVTISNNELISRETPALLIYSVFNRS